MTNAAFNSLQNDPLLPICNYINAFSIFFINIDLMTNDEKNQSVPVINALFDYFNKSKNESLAKSHLLREVFIKGNVYQKDMNTTLDMKYVNETYQYIIIDSLFRRCGNITEYLSGYKNREKNITFSAIRNIVHEALSDKCISNNSCSTSSGFKKLTPLATQKIEEYVWSSYNYGRFSEEFSSQVKKKEVTKHKRYRRQPSTYSEDYSQRPNDVAENEFELLIKTKPDATYDITDEERQVIQKFLQDADEDQSSMNDFLFDNEAITNTVLNSVEDFGIYDDINNERLNGEDFTQWQTATEDVQEVIQDDVNDQSNMNDFSYDNEAITNTVLNSVEDFGIYDDINDERLNGEDFTQWQTATEDVQEVIQEDVNNQSNMNDFSYANAVIINTVPNSLENFDNNDDINNKRLNGEDYSQIPTKVIRIDYENDTSVMNTNLVDNQLDVDNVQATSSAHQHKVDAPVLQRKSARLRERTPIYVQLERGPKYSKQRKLENKKSVEIIDSENSKRMLSIEKAPELDRGSKYSKQRKLENKKSVEMIDSGKSKRMLYIGKAPELERGPKYSKQRKLENKKSVEMIDSGKSKRMLSIEKAAKFISSCKTGSNSKKHEKMLKGFLFKLEESGTRVPTYDKFAIDFCNGVDVFTEYEEWNIRKYNHTFVDDVLFHSYFDNIGNFKYEKLRYCPLFSKYPSEFFYDDLRMYDDSIELKKSLGPLDFLQLKLRLQYSTIYASQLAAGTSKRMEASLYRLAIRECEEAWVENSAILFGYAVDKSLDDLYNNSFDGKSYTFQKHVEFSTNHTETITKLEKLARNSLLRGLIMFTVKFNNLAGVVNIDRLFKDNTTGRYIIPQQVTFPIIHTREIRILKQKVYSIELRDKDLKEKKMIDMVKKLHGLYVSDKKVFRFYDPNALPKKPIKAADTNESVEMIDPGKSKRMLSIEKAAKFISSCKAGSNSKEFVKMLKGFLLKMEKSKTLVPTYDEFAIDFCNGVNVSMKYDKWKLNEHNYTFINDVLFQSYFDDIGNGKYEKIRACHIFCYYPLKSLLTDLKFYDRSLELKKTLRLQDFLYLKQHLEYSSTRQTAKKEYTKARLMVSFYRLALRECEEAWVENSASLFGYITVQSPKNFKENIFASDSYKLQNYVQFSADRSEIINYLKSLSGRELGKSVLFTVEFNNLAGVVNIDRLFNDNITGRYIVPENVEFSIIKAGEVNIFGRKVFSVAMRDKDSKEKKMIEMVKKLSYLYDNDENLYRYYDPNTMMLRESRKACKL